MSGLYKGRVQGFKGLGASDLGSRGGWGEDYGLLRHLVLRFPLGFH